MLRTTKSVSVALLVSLITLPVIAATPAGCHKPRTVALKTALARHHCAPLASGATFRFEATPY